MDKRTINSKPEWIIYKDDQRIGQAVTWHKALDILVKQEGIRNTQIDINTEIVFVQGGVGYFKIVKER